MLDGLRTASKSWFGKAIMTIVFGVIIVSFAIWGIGDIFRGFGQGKLGTVGYDRNLVRGLSLRLPERIAASAAADAPRGDQRRGAPGRRRPAGARAAS
ncbi:MAG: SurA N-terminal domain-containing protein [Rhodoblastus sp.]